MGILTIWNIRMIALIYGRIVLSVALQLFYWNLYIAHPIIYLKSFLLETPILNILHPFDLNFLVILPVCAYWLLLSAKIIRLGPLLQLLLATEFDSAFGVNFLLDALLRILLLYFKLLVKLLFIRLVQILWNRCQITIQALHVL